MTVLQTVALPLGDEAGADWKDRIGCPFSRQPTPLLSTARDRHLERRGEKAVNHRATERQRRQTIPKTGGQTRLCLEDCFLVFLCASVPLWFVPSPLLESGKQTRSFFP